jgi:uncharacterized small protein (DUF1192 family)
MVISTLIADADPLRQPWKPGEPLPTLIKILRFGSNPGVKGDFIVTEKTLANLEANQRARGRDHVVIDFQHSTVPGTRAYEESKEPRPVAARKARVVITPDRCIALESPDWTPDGLKHFGDYADCSPAIIHPKDSFEVVAIDSAGMVRNGSTDGLTFCSADMLPAEDTQEEKTMKELLAALIAAKLLPADADEASAVKLVVDMIAKCASCKAMENMTELSADKVKLLVVEEGKAQITALTADVADLKKGREADRKGRICDRALYEGKVIQLDQAAITALSADQLQDHVAKLAVTVPLDQRTRVTSASADPAATAYTPDQAAVARACGNDPDKVYAKKG